MNNGIFRKGMAVALTFLMVAVVFAGVDFAATASAQPIPDLPINPDRATPYDLDGDGWNNYAEVTHGSDALNKDDNPQYNYNYFKEPGVDNDGDGYTNEEENISKSNWEDPQSTPVDVDGDGVPNQIDPDYTIIPIIKDALGESLESIDNNGPLVWINGDEAFPGDPLGLKGAENGGPNEIYKEGKLNENVAFTSTVFDAESLQNPNSLVYTWNFGDGSPVSNEKTPTHKYTTAGEYTAKLTVTDDGKNIVGVQKDPLPGNDTIKVIIKGNELPIVVATAARSDGKDFDPHPTGGSTNSATTKVDFSAGVVQGTAVPLSGELGGPEYVVTDDPDVAQNATYDPDGTIVKYEWQFEAGGQWTDCTATKGVVTGHQYATTETKVATLCVTDNEGGVSTATVTINVVANQLPIPVMTDNVGGRTHTGTNITFDGSGSTDSDTDETAITKYEWQWETGGVWEDKTTTKTATHTYDTEGIYAVTLRVTDDDGATNTTTKTIVIAANQNPTAVAIADKYEVYEGDIVTFDGTGSRDPEQETLTYNWNFGDETPEYNTTSIQGQVIDPASTARHIFTVKNRNWSLTEFGLSTYQVNLTVADPHGANNITTIEIIVKQREIGFNAPPIVKILPDPTQEGISNIQKSGKVNNAINFSAIVFDAENPTGANLTYKWNFGDGQNSTDVESYYGLKYTLHTYEQPGTYTVSLTVTDSGVLFIGGSEQNGTDTIKVIIAENKLPIVVATAARGDDNAKGVTQVHPTGGSTNAATTKVDFSAGIGDGLSVPASEAGAEDVTIFPDTTYDPDGTITKVEWKFFEGDGWHDYTSANGEVTGYAYDSVGAKVATLRVTDNDGATNTSSVTINVVANKLPIPVMTDNVGGSTHTSQEITFDGTASTDSDTDKTAITNYEWQWTADGAYESSGTTKTAKHTYTVAGTYAVTLRVTDDDGATNTTTKTIVIVDNTVPDFVIVSPNDRQKVEMLSSVSFEISVTGANDPGDTYTITWNFGDVIPGYSTLNIANPLELIDEGSSAQHVYLIPGTFVVRATLTDDHGASKTKTIGLIVGMPSFWDSDLDGLNDTAEKEYGTNPYNSDTDGDSFPDGVEVNAESDPKNKDETPITMASGNLGNISKTANEAINQTMIQIFYYWGMANDTANETANTIIAAFYSGYEAMNQSMNDAMEMAMENFTYYSGMAMDYANATQEQFNAIFYFDQENQKLYINASKVDGNLTDIVLPDDLPSGYNFTDPTGKYYFNISKDNPSLIDTNADPQTILEEIAAAITGFVDGIVQQVSDFFAPIIAMLNDFDSDGVPNGDDGTMWKAGPLTVTAPNGGEKIKGTYAITWSDDWKTANYTIQYRVDNVSNWVDVFLTANKTYEWNTSELTDGVNYTIRIKSGRGNNDTSDAVFTIDNTVPTIIDFFVTSVEENATLYANVSDASGISNYSINWGDETVENFDVGSSNSTVVAINEIHTYTTSGAHNITLIVYDNAVDKDGKHNVNSTEESVTVIITPPQNNLPTLSNGKNVTLDANFPQNAVFLVDYTDADGDAPKYVNVSITNTNPSNVETQIAMEPVPWQSMEPDYTAGITYYCVTNLMAGEYTYKFITSDGKGEPVETAPSTFKISNSMPAPPDHFNTSENGIPLPYYVNVTMGGEGMPSVDTNFTTDAIQAAIEAALANIPGSFNTSDTPLPLPFYVNISADPANPVNTNATDAMTALITGILDEMLGNVPGHFNTSENGIPLPFYVNISADPANPISTNATDAAADVKKQVEAALADARAKVEGAAAEAEAEAQAIIDEIPAPEGIIAQITDAANTVVGTIMGLPGMITKAVNDAIITIVRLAIPSYNGNPNDLDGDRYSNTEEIGANSNPLDPKSRPRSGPRLLPEIL
jgi:PKD repeat protein